MTWHPWAAALLAAGSLAAGASACPFCSAQGQTLSGEVAQADLIVLGTVTNPRRDPDDPTRGSTDLAIETVVKPHDYLKGKTTLTIPRPITPPTDGSKFLVFGSVYPRSEEFAVAAAASSAVLGNPASAQLDPYRGEPVPPKSQLADYLRGALEVKGKDVQARLRYFFDYLDAPEIAVSTDAMMEFGNADYKDVRVLAEKLPAAKIAGWLKDPNTPPSRMGLYGLLIGHCGTKSDADVVKSLLTDADKLYSSGLDGIMAAYILLDKKAGVDYLTATLKDASKEFPVRYAALKVLRFFWEYRPDVMGKDEVLAGVRELVAQGDIADIPMEDLRKWGRWEQTEFVLQFGKQESHNKVPIVRRAILRFALGAAKANPAAAAYVEQARKENAERVREVEQLLLDEQPKSGQ